MHFIVGLLVNVVAAINFHGSGEPQDATTTVGACGATNVFTTEVTFTL
jgi:hypothetical protein